jgi:hypothetical protein
MVAEAEWAGGSMGEGMDSLLRASSLETIGLITTLITAAMSISTGSGPCAVWQGRVVVASVSDGFWEGCLSFCPLWAEDSVGVRLAACEGFLHGVHSGSSSKERPICAAASIRHPLEASATAHQMCSSRSLLRSLIWYTFHLSRASAITSVA